MGLFYRYKQYGPARQDGSDIKRTGTADPLLQKRQKTDLSLKLSQKAAIFLKNSLILADRLIKTLFLRQNYVNLNNKKR